MYNIQLLQLECKSNFRKYILDELILLKISNLSKKFGASGAGKSTLLRMLNRLTDPTDGDIIYKARNISNLRGSDKRGWQSECAMIFQQFNLVPRMDVVSNVLHGGLNKQNTLSTMFNIFPKKDIHNAIDILERLGIFRPII